VTASPSVVASPHRLPGALVIELRRAPKNVLDLAAIAALDRRLAEIEAGGEARVLILRSAIDGVFSAGVDVAAHAPQGAEAMLDSFHALVRRWHASRCVTLAVVEGPCLGGACELVALCDLAVASPRATFGQPEIALGCFPPVATVVLPRLIGKAAAALVLGGEAIPAEEARRLGLLTVVCEDPRAEADRWAALLLSRSGRALAAARRALREGSHGPFEEALRRTEQIYREEVIPSHDAGEGVAAFLEKRPPRFQHR
jgi:cyclohexa-1,5-dienecarbonyl-CoA hydratase